MKKIFLIKELFNFSIKDLFKLRIKIFRKKVKPISIRYIKDIPNKTNLKFFFDTKNKKSYKRFLKDKKNTIKNANKICNNVFNLLGSGNKFLGKNINWREDFKSGYSWPLISYNKIKIDLSKKADIKVPWELSRFQFSTELGKAYWYTGKKKYLEKWKELILDWIKKNPVEYGPNWACTMDVAIRAVNWITGYFFFEDKLDEIFKKEFYKNLYMHGLFIRNNLELFPVKNNHYLSDIVGLIYLGLFFGRKDWVNFGKKELENEIKNQVFNDGVNYETSISYHRLVTELFLSATILLMKNGIKMSNEFMKKLKKMIEFVMYYTKPNGLAPMIGDNDDGRLHIFSHNNINDHRYLISIGAVLFYNKLFKKYSNGFNEEAFWLLDLTGYRKFKSIKKTYEKLTSKSFREGGFHIIRSYKNYIIIRCGKHGLNGLGSHNHNDQLSFELNISGKDIFIDPGTYIYTGDAKNRNFFRSTEMHNTIRIDKKEQNKIYPEIVFFLTDNTKSKLIKFIKNNKIIFVGEHYGYKKLMDPVTHQRTIIFDKNKIIIKESLKGKKSHFIEIIFHLVRNIKIRKTIKEIKIGKLSMTIPKNFKVKIKEGFISESYGIKEKSKIIVFYKNLKLPEIITYKIKF